ncbi:NTP pyrophosphatase, house-cleaning of non-canonical NTPs [Geoalkalibacter ferrihydriticus]|uniref:NTP pyrophosphohydrolase n=2 Tax=Geoalkalibacter ferrihydriticus TaxID=392333 RepID=A0A0C2HV71_9BACT|nr:nucleotide pyrophosphohydrolase [Geoalkalibacter ferrihydriticus]KIH76672.1 NTP pyrophosphohydrolase [Geoalkalibacter ferrihydriticus DSM 17813]SDM05876.1 NTP pyrophosphatase, house-cleaning of non-canonical NTPs [Geoalkalibacter ferrihydriticus]
MSKSPDDDRTTLKELKDRVAVFVRERDWQQFHTPKNLSMSIAIEAAELMEHFQWLSPEASQNPEPEALAEIGEELADIVIYSLSLANTLGLDLARTVEAKMEKNVRKYPAERVKGKAHKYTWYEDKSEV